MAGQRTPPVRNLHSNERMKTTIPFLATCLLAGALQGAEKTTVETTAPAPLSVVPAQPAAPVPPRAASPSRNRHADEVAELEARSESIARELQQRVQAQVERAAREVERQIPAINSGLARMGRHFGTAYVRAGGPQAFRSLVLPAPGGSGPSISQTKEELAIMSRLVEKSLQPESERSSNPFRFEFGDVALGGRNDLDALYVGGHGAIFLIEVDYPLAPAPAGIARKPQKGSDPDDPWEKARREVRGEPDADREEVEPGFPVHTPEARPYDKARVEALRERLVEVLHQARNLKCLGTTESVTLVVTGPGPRAREHRQVRGRAVTRERGEDDRTDVVIVDGGGLAQGQSSGTLMTLQVTKQDLDSLAAGTLTPEAFVGKVRVSAQLERGVGDSGATREQPAAEAGR